MKRLLKLHHHKHTGKVLHHRHTSYRALGVVMLLVGLCMGLTTQMAKADDIAVSAKIPAPIPTGKPVFTAPANNTTVSNPDVNFEGTCPIETPTVVIAIYDGASILGSSPCEPDGTFALTATISPGVRTIAAKVVTITNDFGETSDPLTITYLPPQPTTPASPSIPPTRPGTPASPSSPTGGSLSINPSAAYITFGPLKPAAWTSQFSGGTPPYTVIIDWGDGTRAQTITSVAADTPLSLTHRYSEQRSYTITVTITDASGASLTRHYAAVTLAPATYPSGTLTFPQFDTERFTYLTYLLYFATLLILGLFWWAERFFSKSVALSTSHNRGNKSYHP